MNTLPRGTDRPPLLLWFLLPGSLGFAAGFFGPLIFSPDSNQGPLLGIFITGPGGALLGLVLGLAVRLLRLPVGLQWWTLLGTCAALVVGTLYLSQPEPRVRGYILEAEFRTCGPPVQALGPAMQRWEKVLAGTDARPGWQEDARRSAESDPGVVLELRVVRMIRLREHRKPWNRGRITAEASEAGNAARRYYARYAGGSCENYPLGPTSLHFVAGGSGPPRGGPREWPPTREVASFLGLSTLVPLPDEYRRFIENPGGR